MEAVPSGGTAANPAGQSSLVRCLAQLNDDVLTAYLLPKLVEQGCVGPVALTCSQLRRLCKLSTQHLDLSKPLQDNPCHGPEIAKQLVARFSNCTSLDFGWANSNTADAYSGISPLLAGLPNLNSISIKPTPAATAGSSNGGDPTPLLSQLCLHATGLHCLSLQFNTTWKGYAKFWASLGSLVNLTRLELTFSRDEEYSFAPSSLQALARLTKLQSLVIDGFSAEFQLPKKDKAVELLAQQFPGRLTALTRLSLHWEVLPTISSVSACVNLQDLHLRFWDGGLPELSKKDWDGLAQLTCLTKLYVDVDSDTMGIKHLFTVIGLLKELRVVGVSSWYPSALPKLQSLTHLTALYGYWERGPWERLPRDVGRVCCPHIRELGETGRMVPFAAFPNLAHVTFRCADALNLRSVSRHCTALETLTVCHKAFERASAGCCTSVFRRLAMLKHLTHLELPQLKDCELLAFTSAAAGVGPLKLQHLDVCGLLSVSALMQLQSFPGLEDLVVHVSSSELVSGTFTVEAVRAWLVGIAMVPKVCLVVSTAEQRGVFDAARQLATQHKLPLPEILTVSVDYVADSLDGAAGGCTGACSVANVGGSDDSGSDGYGYGYDDDGGGSPGGSGSGSGDDMSGSEDGDGDSGSYDDDADGSGSSDGDAGASASEGEGDE